ncbi:MAG: helix-turn-helix domain-containing protein [Desulfovibrio sp.]|nr:helix-turn-helix domain-containing protein [Desulfovibrio sp.]
MEGAYSHVPAASLKAVEDPATCGLVTCADFADATGLAVRTVQKMAQTGRIEATKPSWCRQWMIPASEAVRVSAELEEVRHG